MPIKYLALEDTDEVITLVEDKSKVEQIQEGEEEEEEEEKDNNNQGVRLNSEKPIVIRQDVQSAPARELQAYLKALENTSANPRHHSHVTIVQNGSFIVCRSLDLVTGMIFRGDTREENQELLENTCRVLLECIQLQVAQRGCGCLIAGSVQGQVGPGALRNLL